MKQNCSLLNDYTLEIGPSALADKIVRIASWARSNNRNVLFYLAAREAALVQARNAYTRRGDRYGRAVCSSPSGRHTSP